MEHRTSPVADGTRRRALVTGASDGIGTAFAHALAERAYALILVARRLDRLETLATQLRERWGVAVEVLPADLTRAADLRAVEAAIGVDPLAILVNSAGVATVGPFASLDAEREAAQIALNVVALVRLTRAALPGMLARRNGAIINVSSFAAFVPGRFTATYGATKAYLNSFTEALYEELRGSGVRVQALCPGFTRTAFVRQAGFSTRAIPSIAWMRPEAVVKASLAALERNAAVCVPGRRHRALKALLFIVPRRLARRIMGVGAKRGWASDSLRGSGG